MAANCTVFGGENKSAYDVCTDLRIVGILTYACLALYALSTMLDLLLCAAPRLQSKATRNLLIFFWLAACACANCISLIWRNLMTDVATFPLVGTMSTATVGRGELYNHPAAIFVLVRPMHTPTMHHQPTCCQIATIWPLPVMTAVFLNWCCRLRHRKGIRVEGYYFVA